MISEIDGAVDVVDQVGSDHRGVPHSLKDEVVENVDVAHREDSAVDHKRACCFHMMDVVADVGQDNDVKRKDGDEAQEVSEGRVGMDHDEEGEDMVYSAVDDAEGGGQHARVNGWFDGCEVEVVQGIRRCTVSDNDAEVDRADKGQDGVSVDEDEVLVGIPVRQVDGAERTESFPPPVLDCRGRGWRTLYLYLLDRYEGLIVFLD
ncbi:hypothetical protein BGZ49_009470 [Haplosporangium sp. Z 27]|nr:hypothetical protein BGZ49_009470 [Haplosporangium sp. Z 27]